MPSDIVGEIDKDFTPEDVHTILRLSPTNKAAGPDMVHGAVLRLASEHSVVCDVIASRLNSIMGGKANLDDLLVATCVLLPKKSKPSRGSDCRPISLLPMILKSMEQCVLSRIAPIIDAFFCWEQAAFRKGRSCITHAFILKALQSDAKRTRSILLACFLDLRKAYDSAEPAILLPLIRNLSSIGRLRNFLASMMRPRKVRVATACGTSKPFVATRSVPQGSVLACLLFNLSMEVCNTSLAIGTPSLSPKIVLPDGIIKIINRLLFADDQTILVHGRNLPICVTEMNNRLKSAALWAERSMNQYAPEKSFVVPLGNRLRETSNSQFTLRDSEIEVVFNFSYLGVDLLSSKRVLWAPLHRKAKATAAVSAALHVYRAMAPVFIVRLAVTVGWSALLYGHDLAFPKPSALDTCCNNLLKIGLGLPTWTPTAFLYLALHVPVASAIHLKRSLISWNTIFHCDAIHRCLLSKTMADESSDMWRGFIAFGSKVGICSSSIFDCITSEPLVARRKAHDLSLLAANQIIDEAIARASSRISIGNHFVSCCGIFLPLPLKDFVMHHQDGRTAIRVLVPFSLNRTHPCPLCSKSANTSDSASHLLMYCTAGPRMKAEQVYSAFTSESASTLLVAIANAVLKRNLAITRLLSDK